MKNRNVSLLIVTFAVAAAASLTVGHGLFAAEDEMAKHEKALSNTKKELEEYRKGLPNSPALAGMKKEIAALDLSLKAKDKELAAILDSRLNKNPAYAELDSKAKELGAIEAELRKYRAAVDASPEIAGLRKESADLRARAQAREQEARKLADSKFNSDQKVKELLPRREAASKAQRDASDLKRNVMNEPQVKALNTELAEFKKSLAAKNGQLANATNNLFKTDVRLKALELRLTELNKKIGELRKAKKGQARVSRPGAPPAAKQAAPAKESLIDKLKRKVGKK